MRRRLEALRALGIDFGEIDDTLDFLGGDGDVDELLEGPFRTDPAFSRPKTRFSDGSWPVFYSAEDWATAEAEVGYHIASAAIGTPASNPVFFQRLECDVEGRGYDLCAHVGSWPFLTDPDENSYANCQSAAREAKANGAEVLATRSARRPSGVNIPVFVRTALSNPQIIGSAAITSEPGGLRVQLR